MKRLILLPDEIDPEAQRQRAARASAAFRLFRACSAIPALKTRAAEIHASRMMTGDPCPDCIEMAVRQLGLDLPEWRWQHFDDQPRCTCEFARIQVPWVDECSSCMRLLPEHKDLMPECRFATREDAQAGINPIPSHIEQGNKIVPNPAYASAPFAVRYVAQ